MSICLTDLNSFNADIKTSCIELWPFIFAFCVTPLKITKVICIKLNLNENLLLLLVSCAHIRYVHKVSLHFGRMTFAATAARILM